MSAPDRTERRSGVIGRHQQRHAVKVQAIVTGLAPSILPLDVRGGNCEPILIPLSRLREREIDDHSTSRANHYFRREHLVIRDVSRRGMYIAFGTHAAAVDEE